MPIALDDLFAVGWPGESVAIASRAHRVDVAVTTLRKAGLDASLASTEVGWLLNPSVRVAALDERHEDAASPFAPNG